MAFDRPFDTFVTDSFQGVDDFGIGHCLVIQDGQESRFPLSLHGSVREGSESVPASYHDIRLASPGVGARREMRHVFGGHASAALAQRGAHGLSY